MQIFLAGASGVIGVRLIPLLVRDGNQIAGMTRSAGKAAERRELGAEPAVGRRAWYQRADPGRACGPELVMHQLTDLPDQVEWIAEFATRNNRIRTEGQRNLLAAAAQAGEHPDRQRQTSPRHAPPAEDSSLLPITASTASHRR